MEIEKLECGSLVVSTQGRDKGRNYLVIKVEDAYLWLCDGNYKKQANPKKKKRKHCEPLGRTATAIGQKLKTGKQVFDSEIYSALRISNEEKKN